MNQFSFSVNYGLYVVLWHRNHLGIMSADSISTCCGYYEYNFTIDENTAFGGINVQKELYNGIWGMISSDGNADGYIDNTDRIDIWMLQSGNSGYLQGDFSLDGHVNNQDKVDQWIPNAGKSCQVPN